jgi:hypothetical protein
VGAVQLKLIELDAVEITVNPVGAGVTAVQVEFTVSVTVLLVTDPALLVTTT